MIFFDDSSTVQISNTTRLSFFCPSNEFSIYEPDYQPLTLPHTSRYWSPTHQYCSTAVEQQPDDHYNWERFKRYCAKIEQYQVAYDLMHPIQPPEQPQYTNIYVDITFSGGDNMPIPAIYPDDPDPALQTLSISGLILSNPNDPATIMPVSHIWRTPIFQVSCEKFAWVQDYRPLIIGSFQQQIDVEQGQFSIPAFRRTQEGVFMISDDCFELVDGALFGMVGTSYKVNVVGEYKFFKVVAGERIKKAK